MTLPEKATAREALGQIAGPSHAAHSVMSFWIERDFLVVRCSCNSAFRAHDTKELRHALRNAREIQAS